MRETKAETKAALIAQYSEALDELLEANEHIEDFAELEEAVSQLAEKTLPATLSRLQATKDFSPSVPKVSKEASE